MAKLEVSDIAHSIEGRIREVEEQLKDHQALSDELERLKGALGRLEGGVRSRVDGRRRGQRPVTQRATAPVPENTSPATSTTARAPRGENKKKILAALKDGPKTACDTPRRGPRLRSRRVPPGRTGWSDSGGQPF
jgi:hypothetical protein